MAELDEIKKEVFSDVETELDAWESFYRKFKQDYARIAEYENRIAGLEEELKNRDRLLKGRWQRERGSLLLLTSAFIVASLFAVLLISSSKNVWPYFFAGLLIGLGAFSLIYLWTR